MKKQTTITACTFVTMAMEAPAVFVVQPAMSKHVKYEDHRTALQLVNKGRGNRPIQTRCQQPSQIQHYLCLRGLPFHHLPANGNVHKKGGKLTK